MDRILKSEGDSPDRYKLAKQADTCMLFYLLPEQELLRVRCVCCVCGACVWCVCVVRVCGASVRCECALHSSSTLRRYSPSSGIRSRGS